MAQWKQRKYSNLSTVVEDWVTETEERMLAVMRASLNDVVDNAQTTTSRGGRMRYDTGFLSWSGRAAVGSMSSGPSVRPDDARPGTYTWDGEALTATLAKMQMGDTFYYGWTADYAARRELYDGFMDGALMHWPQIVAFNIDTLAKRTGRK